ncbi:MAG TPA: glycosyl transferase [Anaerolineaceae bacterium]|nr:glycosyl transferase [Anaerolineaceae bacterium]
MHYGFFDDKREEYVITQPDTPLPWINYLGCEDFFGIISNTGGGYAFYKDARLRRITRYRYNNVPSDTGGRYLYFRDITEANEPNSDIWSPTWQPVRKKLNTYSCHHGLGYTRIKSTYNAIESDICYFVPLGENLEIWDVKITNTKTTRVNLSVFSAIEFCLWDAWDDATNFQRNFSIGEVEVEDGVIYHKSEYRERRNHFAYFACSEEICGFDTQRDEFIGTYRGWDSPIAVEENQSRNSIAVGWQPIGSHHLEITLDPGASKRIIFILGYQENPVGQKFTDEHAQIINKEVAKSTIQKFFDFTNVDEAFIELNKYWKKILSTYHVKTPNEHVNRMVNIWNAYQVMATFNLSRSASLFESGVGRGMGFRDSNQDLLGFSMLDPKQARERILDLAATQLLSGGTYHQYQPLSKRGNNDIGGGFNDDPLWLVLSVAAYIKETDDWDILHEYTPFDNQLSTQEPLYSHMQRSMQYTLDRLGPHKLPLIGRADWNDCLNLNCFSDSPGQSFQTTTNKDGKTAESVFLAGMFILAGKEMIEIASHLKKHEDKHRYQTAIKEMEKVIWDAGWDGEWFKRAYDFYGNPVGSHENQEGKIFIEPQGMCIMAGLGIENEKAHKALNSVEKYLATKDGILLTQPAFSKYYLNLGEISSYPPGYKENASVFCHTNPWIMIAETMVGHGDKALDYYLRINPSAREEISEIHKCEPYVYAQMISGRDAPIQGEAKNSWLTGTAAWNYVAITQWILGIRPTYEGLQINPVIPATWDGFSITRIFRGKQYNIEVKREGPGNQVTLIVAGNTLDGNILKNEQFESQKVDVLAVLK